MYYMKKTEGFNYNTDNIRNALRNRRSSLSQEERTRKIRANMTVDGGRFDDELLCGKYSKTMKIGEDTAYKPYFYLRNGLLHVRYMADRCIELSPSEEDRMKAEIASHGEFRQQILGSQFESLIRNFGRKILDGRTLYRQVTERLSNFCRKAETPHAPKEAPSKKKYIVRIKK